MKKTRRNPIAPCHYEAQIFGEAKAIRGFDELSNLCLARGARYTFRPLIESAIVPASRLIAVASLRFTGEGWMVDGDSLNDWFTSLNGKEHHERSPTARRLLDLFLFLDEADLPNKLTARIEAVAWFEGKEFADGSGEPLLLASFRQIAPSRSGGTGKGMCGVCGWQHDDNLTEIRGPRNRPIKLRGILPKIVAAIHKVHEQGDSGTSMKGDAMKQVCEGYGHPSKAFNDLGCSDVYKLLFDTSRRGWIALRRKS